MAHEEVYVPFQRECDLCPNKAYADARIPGGGWAWVCRSHFDMMGCSLGLGNGQKLIVGTPPVKQRSIATEVADALGVTEDEIDF